ncbi:MAG: ABC transporter permease, partial [Firmicutes bacterium]|nr:ABC transporter permease [Bacillota bacterium]
MKSRISAAPYLFWAALFIVIPLVLVAIFAFTDADGHFTLDNFKASVDYAPVIFNSIWLSIIATAICLVIAYPLSYFISRRTESKQRTLIMLVMLPMW